MSNLDTIGCLTNILDVLKNQQPSVSLRLWYDKGTLNFFLSNLPSRNKRRMTVSQDDFPDETGVRGPPPPLLESSPPSIKTKQRGKKRRCNVSPPDQLRESSSPGGHQVSFIDEQRDVSIVSLSVPCSNSFDALTNLHDDQELEPESAESLITNGSVESKPSPVMMRCRRCSEQLNKIENNKDVGSQYYCRGRPCGKTIYFETDTTFFKCDCLYAPYVCEDCVHNLPEYEVTAA